MSTGSVVKTATYNEGKTIMTTPRVSFHSIRGLSLGIRQSTDADVEKSEFNINPGDIVLFRRDNNKIVGSVSPDDLFAANGNRFSFD